MANNLSDEEEAKLVIELQAADEAVKAAADKVTALKKEKATKEVILAAVETLAEAKAAASKIRLVLSPLEKLEISRESLDNLLLRKFFFAPSFGIYGGVKGFYDYGPPGCAIKNNILNFWRQWFILEENMLEIDTSTITPEVVFQHSGHVAKFCDFMVKDLTTGAYHRADHLLEDFMDELLTSPNCPNDKRAEYESVRRLADDYSQEQLTDVFKQYGVTSPEGNAVSDPFPANLMFETTVGRSAAGASYLRPETAQGIFVNFARLLEFNGGKIPFAAATIGLAYRNEIAPRAGLLRVREFTMAEIEHFVDPADKSHHKFHTVKDVKVNLFSQERQARTIPRPQELTIAQAYEQKVITSETMSYLLARVHLFLVAIGIKPQYLRFRQHRANEMAHYACDCWDAEILTTYGWIECVGIADRSCYDLSQHAKGSSARLSVFKQYDKPIEVESLVLTPVKNLIFKKYTKVAQPLLTYLSNLSEDLVAALQTELEANKTKTIVINDHTYEIELNMVQFKQTKTKVGGENIIPSVFEPSFGIGRIMYSLLEHSFFSREGDENRNVLSLSPIIAPVKCSVLPLQQNKKFVPIVQKISQLLTAAGISNKVDDVGQSIGKRYARTDEIGIPFGVTIDFITAEELEGATPEKATVTLRDRDSTLQVRVPINELAGVLGRLVNATSTWAAEQATYPAYITEDKS